MELVGHFGKFNTDTNIDVDHLVFKFQKLVDQKVDTPISHIHNSMKCTLDVEDLSALEKAVDAILEDYEGFVLDVKPKLDNPVKPKVVIHVITWQNKAASIPDKMGGQIVVSLARGLEGNSVELACDAQEELIKLLETFTEDTPEKRDQLDDEYSAIVGRLATALIQRIA